MKKKFIVLGIASAMMLVLSQAAFAGEVFEGLQTASATLDQGTNEVNVTVDLSDGWSVDFAPGAVYLYDGPNDEGVEAVAIGLTLDKEVYDDYIKDAKGNEDYYEEDGITFFTDDDGSANYVFEVSDSSYFMISVDGNEDADEVFNRFDVTTYELEELEMNGIESYGSEIYSDEEIADAEDVVLDEFDNWEGCELTSIDYAGDDALTDENVDWLEGLSDGEYDQYIGFTMDFHSPTEEADIEGTAWEPDTEYTDYEWWLGRADGGDWEVITFGY